MRSTKVIHIVSCHAEGEVGNVIVGGVSPPPGDSVWEQSRWIENDQALRQFVLNEPRGGVFKHVNLLVPPKDKTAVFGFIIMEPEHTPPMSGSNSICVATVLLDSGLIQMREPETTFLLEAPAGIVPVKAYCENGKAKSIEIQNLPSFADKLGVKLDRSPCGTGCSARMAVLHARGEMQIGDRFIANSIIGSRFDCTILNRTRIGKVTAIIPTIRGRGWITGTHQLMCDPEDPWPGGYRLTDTWPKRTN